MNNINIQQFWKSLKDIITTDEVFGFIARSQENPLTGGQAS
ncbi:MULTISPECIES: hypothetical protein [Microcystis]|nr:MULTISPECIES: hypothetical protein [Microcystis]